MMRASRPMALSGSRPGPAGTPPPVCPASAPILPGEPGLRTGSAGRAGLNRGSAVVAFAVEVHREVVDGADVAVLPGDGVPGSGAVDVRRQVHPAVTDPVVGLAEAGDHAAAEPEGAVGQAVYGEH